MDRLAYKLYYERRMPHFQPAGATLFITFRLAGSLPKSVMNALRIYAHHQEQAIARIPDPVERTRLLDESQRRIFGRWDRALDTVKQGPFWLRQPEIAELVAGAIHARDGEHLDLLAYCLMANHVHLVCTPLRDEKGQPLSLSKMMQSLKGYTAQEANKLLERKGAFWQHESFDHWVRDEDELNRVVWYTRNNPVRAGLIDDETKWPWTYVREPLFS